MKRKIKREEIIERLRKLTESRSNDIVKLVFTNSQEDLQSVDDMDLTLLTEIKRNEKGAVEIKLINKFDVLKFLIDLTEGVDCDSSNLDNFIRALDKPSKEGKE